MLKTTKQPNYINHIVLLVDSSGSMQGLESQVVKVFDSQIQHLAVRSKELDQETRATVYFFNDVVENIFYDKDVLRLPSLAGLYKPNKGTALLQATLKAIADLQKTPELYGDHSFLIYILTDGENNIGNHLASSVSSQIAALPDNWTLAVLVPNQTGVHEAKRFGFPVNNIQVWSTTKDGIMEVGETIKKATDTYMISRSLGTRGTKNLFNLDASALNTSTIKNNLQEINPSEYELLPVRRDEVIKPFVESWMKTYTVGSAYYQLVKPEIIQSGKNICIQNKKNGKVFSGNNARQIIGLPSVEIKVNPISYGEYDIFVQSTSTNRKLPAGTKLIVLK